MASARKCTAPFSLTVATPSGEPRPVNAQAVRPASAMKKPSAAPATPGGLEMGRFQIPSRVRVRPASAMNKPSAASATPGRLEMGRVQIASRVGVRPASAMKKLSVAPAAPGGLASGRAQTATYKRVPQSLLTAQGFSRASPLLGPFIATAASQGFGIDIKGQPAPRPPCRRSFSYLQKLSILTSGAVQG